MASRTETEHGFTGDSCTHPRCQEADGWQCAECGHYFDRSQVKDVDGEYYCRDNKGHNA